MKVAIIGLPYSGKSTLFSAVTSLRLSASELVKEKYAVVAVPDPRIDLLARLYQPKKVTHASIEFTDVPGFSLADARGQEELRRHLPVMRGSDVLLLVVRDFENASVPAYRNRVNRAADLAELFDELIFADLDTVAKRIEKLDKALAKPTKSHEQEKKEMAVLKTCQQALESSTPLSAAITTQEESRMLGSFALLTEKPAVVVYNVDIERAGGPLAEPPEHFHSAIALCADVEAQIVDLDPEEQREFMADLGIETTARDRLIHQCYRAADLISFFTVGGEEVRAWSIRRGTPAVEAAGKVHTDFARGFIRAETVSYEDLAESGDHRAAKAAGKVRQEGKSYVVQDGDIINVKFNL